MKTIKIISGSLICFFVAFCFVTGAFAVELEPKIPAVIKDKTIRPIALSADLVLQYIEYFNCPCAIDSSLNTEYVTDLIAVKVGNASTANAVGAKITVSYYDVTTRSTATATKTVTLNANQWMKVTMVQKPLLIGKSQGVTAVIEHTNSAITDPNPANNSAVQKICGQMVE